MNRTNAPDLGNVRVAALERVDRGRRYLTWAIIAVAMVEATLLVTFLLLMDYRDRLHWLLLVAALLVYCTLGLGLVALGAYVNLVTQRILKAIALQGEPESRTPE
jgi:uncharacterized membrane protein YbhN (UPF0104 family)